MHHIIQIYFETDSMRLKLRRVEKWLAAEAERVDRSKQHYSHVVY